MAASGAVPQKQTAMFDEAVSLYPDILDMAESFDESAPTHALADVLRKAAPAPVQRGVLF